MSPPERRLIVNADDFGFTRDVNEGIIAAHRSGIVTATTLMAGGPAFEHAVALAQANPTLDVGCHLVLVQGTSVLHPDRLLPPTVSALAVWLAFGRFNVYQELAAQMKKILSAGIAPTHLDTHKHTHLLPPVLDAVARIAHDFGVPWVRRPFDFRQPSQGLRNRAMLTAATRILQPRFQRQLAGLRGTDHFAGFGLTGVLDEQSLLGTLGNLPPGLTELMCHPGYCGADLMGAATRLKQTREIELRALTSPVVRREIDSMGVRLVRYPDA